jgi:uncharacterized protein
MRVVIAGASGFLGRALSEALAQHGHQVIRLVRRETSLAAESRWDPAAGHVDQGVIASADVVANLAGAPVVRVPWTESYAEAFMASRVDTTRTLAEAVARAERPALLAQSGVAGYGDHGDEVITEDTPIDAPTFMGEVVRRWEAAAEPARAAGARVVTLRTGVVLDGSGSALRAMLVPFRLGLGGRIGSGRQYFPTISLQDWVGAATYLAQNPELSGPFNLSGPEPVTNAEFSDALGRALHRPAAFRVPGLPLRKVGPIGSEMLTSARVEPRRLLEAGFAFAHNDITDQLAAALR